MTINKEFEKVALKVTLSPWETAVIKNALTFWETATRGLTHGNPNYRDIACHNVVVELIDKISNFEDQIRYQV